MPMGISDWRWTQIAGPASSALRIRQLQKTVVKNFTKGIYQFELKVTDAGGLSAKDTVQVAVTMQPGGNENTPQVNVQAHTFWYSSETKSRYGGSVGRK